MREDELIARLRAELPVPDGVRGVGDDCCVWTPGGETCLSVDTVVEGVHFAVGTDPTVVGRKAAAAALSDLAAMGARPVGAVVALSRGEGIDELAVMHGLRDELARHGCPLLGGDTTGGERLVVSVTVWGEAAGGRLVFRDGAGVGDVLAVTGWLGGSLASGRHLRPEPRFAAGAWFAGQDAVTAMIDLSDGLASDGPRLAAASGCGCVLLPNEILVHPELESRADRGRRACCDGEDYELLVAVDARCWPLFQAAWPFDDLPLTRVGWLVDEPGCYMEDHAGRLVPCPWKGFEHA